MKQSFTILLLSLLFPSSILAGLRGGGGCEGEDILEEKFFYATQVRISNVQCTAIRDLRYLGDFITDHLVSPMVLPNNKTITDDKEEIDVCRALPMTNKDPCPEGFLAKHDEGQQSFAWSWRGIGSCGIFKPSPKCHPTSESDESIRRVVDIQRLRGSHNKDADPVPDYASKSWLTDAQKNKLRELATQRDNLVKYDRRLESMLTEKHFVNELQLEDIIEQHKGSEHLILAEILNLYSEYESEALLIKSRLREFEKDLTDKMNDVIGENTHLRDSCFVSEKALVDIVVTPMATEEYAMAYVQEQC